MHMAGINSNAVIRVSRNLNAIFTFSLISKTALYLSTAINSLIVKKITPLGTHVHRANNAHI